jgi:predicted RNase H-like HicB family nuclease
MGISVKISKGEKFYMARAPELGITTQGKTRSKAKKSLKEAMQVHLEAMTGGQFPGSQTESHVTLFTDASFITISLLHRSSTVDRAGTS